MGLRERCLEIRLGRGKDARAVAEYQLFRRVEYREGMESEYLLNL